MQENNFCFQHFLPKKTNSKGTIIFFCFVFSSHTAEEKAIKARAKLYICSYVRGHSSTSVAQLAYGVERINPFTPTRGTAAMKIQ